MGLSRKLEGKLNKTFSFKAKIDEVFNGNDITFITNERGEPVTLFIGKRKENGDIKGERYVRKMVKSEDGTKILKSHWDLKGKVGA